MDLNKIFIKNASPTKIGGQAVLEGVMMKNAQSLAIAIRKPDGDLHIKSETLKQPGKLSKMPIIRGVIAFIDSLVVGTKTLMYSAEVLEEFDEEMEKDKLQLWLEKKFGPKAASDLILCFSVIISVVFTVGIFILFPTFAVNIFKKITDNAILLNLIEGVFRIVLFVIYIALISHLKEIKRVFQYHGAEHKTIHCYENKLELTAENCKQFPTLHPRCGTSFMMFVMVISLLIFSFLGWPNLIIRLSSRLLLIPVIAGLSYELLRWAGKSTSSTVKILSYPGLLLQKLTTNEPDEQQLEVAIASMKAVLESGDRE